MALFTRDNAAIYARKAVQSRLARIQAEKEAELRILERPAESADNTDTFSQTLACACDETLELVRIAKIPQARAQLARALRDLRETWHMATGKPKPGMTRPESGPQRRAVMPRVWPTAPNPGPAPTSNGGSGHMEPEPPAEPPKPA